MSLKKQAAKGFIWVALERFGQQILQGIIFIILARLLSPKDFGLVAMVVIFFALSQTFVDSGMGQALIRQKTITKNERSTVFWFNLMISIVFYTILFITAPLIASFYDETLLVPLIRLMGINIFFFAIAIVQRSEMTQKMEFKRQALAQVPAMLISGIISILMAYNDYGVWAIATQYLSFTFFGSIFLWALHPVKLSFTWDKVVFKNLFGFGNQLLFAGLLNTVFKHIYKLVIGKYFNAATLGFYTQAQKLGELVTNNMTSLIQKVTYPLMSKVHNDKKDLKQGYVQVIKGASFVIFPVVGFMGVMAEPIVTNLLGTRWEPAAPFLQLICISGMVYHVSAINLNLLKVVGKSNLVLRLAFIKKAIVLIALVVGLQFGIWGLLVGRVIASYISLFINQYYTKLIINYQWLYQLKDILQSMLYVIPLLMLVGYVQYSLAETTLWILVLFLGVYFSLYLAIHYLFKTQFLMIAISMLKEKQKPKKKIK